MNFLDLRTGPINGAHLGNSAQNPDEAEPLMDVMTTPEQAAVPAELSSQIALPTSPVPESDDVPAHHTPSPQTTPALADLRPGRRRRKQASESATDSTLQMRAPVTEPNTDAPVQEEDPEPIINEDHVDHEPEPSRKPLLSFSLVRNLFSGKPLRAVVDFGTGYTLAYLEGGTYTELLIEPSIVYGYDFEGRVDPHKITRFGTLAYKSWEKTGKGMKAEWPMENGVISDTELMGPYMKWILNELYKKNGITSKRYMSKTEVVIGVHTKIRHTHLGNMVDCVYAYTKADEVFVVDQVIAAAIGSNSNIMSPDGCIQVDIGDGTALVAVISNGDFIAEGQDYTKTAGRAFSVAIQDAVRDEFDIEIGLPTAEEIKCSLGCAVKPRGEASKVKGNFGGIHRSKGAISFTISTGFVFEALDKSVAIVSRKFGETLGNIKPEQANMAKKRGARLSGGSAQLKGMSDRFMADHKIPVRLAPKPSLAVINGLKTASSNPILRKKVLYTVENKKTVHVPRRP